MSTNKEISLAPPLFLQAIEDTGFSTWLRESESPFAFYFILLFHTFGLALLVGTNMVVDLRLLGVARGIPLVPLKRFFSIMWIGFAINAVTGVLLVIAYPTKSLTNPLATVRNCSLSVAADATWVIRDKPPPSIVIPGAAVGPVMVRLPVTVGNVLASAIVPVTLN